LYMTGDDADTRNIFIDANSVTLKQKLGSPKLLLIDEAQRIPNIGVSIKILHDNFPEMQIIATGSSAFELQNALHEPLTGRNYSYYMYPYMISEVSNSVQYPQELYRYTEDMMIWGMYPSIRENANSEERREQILRITEDYLYKDILAVEDVRKPEVIEKLLKYIAVRIGSKFSVQDAATTLEISRVTVEKYVGILEQAYIIFKLPSYDRNTGTSTSSLPKIYFVDLGIRNAILNKFQTLSERDDAGYLFENMIIAEFFKQKNIPKYGFPILSFWRENEVQEIDLLVQKDGMLKGYECKWNPNKKATKSKLAPTSDLVVVHKENYGEFV
jgi:uncharacterized protein